MKALIVYQSIHHNNTYQVAERMAGVLGARLVKPEELDLSRIGDYDLVGLGSGIYHGQHHIALRDLVKKMLTEKPIDFFVFSTSGTGKSKYNKELKELLVSRGHRVIGEFSCRGWDTYGPWKYLGGLSRKHPDKKDLIKAEEFAKNLIDK
jgi:flavodoxin